MKNSEFVIEIYVKLLHSHPFSRILQNRIAHTSFFGDYLRTYYEDASIMNSFYINSSLYLSMSKNFHSGTCGQRTVHC